MRAMLVRCLCWTPMISNFFWISFVWDLFKCRDIDIYHRSFARNIVFLQSDWHTNCASINDRKQNLDWKKTYIDMTEINMVPTIPPQIEEPPMSRTHQYRKVMKPLLERKRRARINKCLDDIKDLLIDSLQVNRSIQFTFDFGYYLYKWSHDTTKYHYTFFYIFRLNLGSQ